MIDLIGLSREDLLAEMTAMGEKPFRVKQIWHWLYNKGVTDFSKMSTLAKPLQARLAEKYLISRPQVITEKNSTDGTRKWLLRFADGKEVETVYIPEEDRGAVCLSTQVGCQMGCRFCHTGMSHITGNNNFSTFNATYFFQHSHIIKKSLCRM